MLSLLLATAVALAPSLAPEGKSPKVEHATCTPAPVRGAMLERTKKGLEATAFVVGLAGADRAALGLEGGGAMDVVPMSRAEDVRLAHFNVPRGKTLRISVLRPKRKQLKQATIPDDLKEGVIEVDVDEHDNLGIDLLFRHGAEGDTEVIVAVSTPEDLEQVEIRVDGNAPTKVEDGTRWHGASKGTPKAAHASLKKGVYYLSFDNGKTTSAAGRWSGSTTAPWTAAGGSFVGGERCDGGPEPGSAAKKADDGRRRYRRIKKQMISTLQTYTR